MNDPLVSIVVIFCNEESFLAEAIASVMSQEWPHWELIFVDGGSEDRGPEIARECALRHPDRVRDLEWLEAHLARRGIRDARITRAAERSLVEFQHPGLWRLRTTPQDAFRMPRAIGYATLPTLAAFRVRVRWQRHKQRRIDRRLERAGRTVAGWP